MHTSFARIVRFLPLAVLVLALASACSRREELPIQEDVDFSRVGDVFSSGQPAIPSPDAVLATVQGQDITQADLQRETSILLMAQRGQKTPEELAAAARSLAAAAFQNLIRKSLLIDAAEAQDIQVDDAALEEQLEAIKAQLPENQDWEQVLTAQGLDEATVRDQLFVSLRVDKLIKSLTADLDPVFEDEIADVYLANTNRFVQPDTAEFSHILFRVEPGASEEQVEEVKQRAERLHGVVGQQVEFEPIAAKYSDDDSTKDKGGFVGKVVGAQLQPPLRDAIFATAPGEIAPLVRTPVGFHIVRVESLELSRQLALDEVSQTISNRIAEQRSQEKLGAYLETLRETAEIEIVGPLPAGIQP